MDAEQRQQSLSDLMRAVRECKVCESQLPLGPRPLVQVGRRARILIIGQAPGALAHSIGRPWADRSGDRLRDWMGIDGRSFYDPDQLAIVSMGLCYPGHGSGGDLPPRPECAPRWHQRLFAQMPQIRLTLLVGRYALRQQSIAKNVAGAVSVTSMVRDWRLYGPHVMPLPHPSPRNIAWFKANTWFENELVPDLRERVRNVLER